MAAIAFPTGLATRCLPFFIFSVPFAHAASETTLAPVRVYAEQSDFDVRQTTVDRIPLDLGARIEVILAPSADLPNEGLPSAFNLVLRAGGDRLFGEAADMDSRNISAHYGNGSSRFAPAAASPTARSCKSRLARRVRAYSNPGITDPRSKP